MFTFCYKSERDHYVRKIKEDGLETTLREGIEDDTIKCLLSHLFEVAFDKLSDDDYEELVLEVCNSIDYDIHDVWEVYLDVSEDEYTNTNYSVFIISKDEPTIEQATELLRKHNKLEDGYHIRFIQESDWDAEDIEEEDIMYL